jgi:hypothetical protein
VREACWWQREESQQANKHLGYNRGVGRPFSILYKWGGGMVLWVAQPKEFTSSPLKEKPSSCEVRNGRNDPLSLSFSTSPSHYVTSYRKRCSANASELYRDMDASRLLSSPLLSCRVVCREGG